MKFEYKDSFHVSHASVGWLIGIVTGLAIAGFSGRFTSVEGIAAGVLLIFISLQVVKAYNQWVERSTKDNV